MTDALIGWSGYVGGTLLRQRPFDDRFRASDIDTIRGRSFGLVVCAGAPAQKWLANREPEADRARIDALIEHLRHVRCERFVLISTVDVFAVPVGVDEATPVEEQRLHPYGLHRRRLERFVQAQFEHHLIVRLPGLVGPGLRKNVIYDLLNDNALAAVDHRSVFQFYPMVCLWFDLQAALAARLSLLHLTAEPVSVAEVAAGGFGRHFDHACTAEPARYDFRSRHAALFGGSGAYQYDRRASLVAIRAYAQSEPRSARPAA
jgi:hypothetical protein